MGVFNPTGSASGNPNGPSSFVITEVALPGIAETEFTHTIASNTKRFSINTKGTKRFRVAPVTAATDTFKVKGGNTFESGDLVLTGALTLYFTSPDTGDTLQIIEWRG